MASKMTITAANTKKGDSYIAYPRIGVYDVEKEYKDSFSVDKFVAMIEDRDSTVIITAAWSSKTDDSEHNKKTGKVSGSTITITDGDNVRLYEGITEEAFTHFYAVAKSIKNGTSSFDNIKMKTPLRKSA
jgi:hypothetical protein